MPRFSVITVAKNNLAGLHKTHASLQAQTCRDFEWLVADGGSTDGTHDWLLAHQDEMAWYQSAPDAGLYDALNQALPHATGAYVLFLGAGDALAGCEVLSVISRHLIAQGAADFIYGDSLEEDENGAARLKQARSHKRAARGMFTHHPAMLYARSLVADLQFETRWPVGADYAFTLGALKKSKKILRLTVPLAQTEPAGLSAQRAWRGLQDQFEIRRKVGRVPFFMNFYVTAFQAAALVMRRAFPKVYGALRFRRVKAPAA